MATPLGEPFPYLILKMDPDADIEGMRKIMRSKTPTEITALPPRTGKDTYVVCSENPDKSGIFYLALV